MVFQKVKNDDGVGTLDIFEQLNILRAVIKDQNGEERKQNHENAKQNDGESLQKDDYKRIQVSVILATSRQFPRHRMEEDFETALVCMQKYPDLISGMLFLTHGLSSFRCNC